MLRLLKIGALGMLLALSLGSQSASAKDLHEPFSGLVEEWSCSQPEDMMHQEINAGPEGAPACPTGSIPTLWYCIPKQMTTGSPPAEAPGCVAGTTAVRQPLQRDFTREFPWDTDRRERWFSAALSALQGNEWTHNQDDLVDDDAPTERAYHKWSCTRRSAIDPGEVDGRELGGPACPDDFAATRWYCQSNSTVGNYLLHLDITALSPPDCGKTHTAVRFPIFEDYVRAVRWLEKKDYPEALSFFRQLAPTDARAQFQLALMYRQGLGMAPDRVQGTALLLKSAFAGVTEARHAVGHLFLEGSDVPKDEVEAMRWFRWAAEAGYAPAEVQLGLGYAKGVGIRLSTAEATYWYGKAAEQGSSEARALLNESVRNPPEERPALPEGVEWKDPLCGLADGMKGTPLALEGTGVAHETARLALEPSGPGESDPGNLRAAFFGNDRDGALLAVSFLTGYMGTKNIKAVRLLKHEPTREHDMTIGWHDWREFYSPTIYLYNADKPHPEFSDRESVDQAFVIFKFDEGKNEYRPYTTERGDLPDRQRPIYQSSLTRFVDGTQGPD